MADRDIKDEELLALYRARIKDRAQSKTKRRRQSEARPKPFSDLLNSYFKADGVALRKIEESRALMAWETYVGSSAARVAKAERIRNNTLVVRVTDPLWTQQLLLLKHELLGKFQKEFPKLQLKDIFFTRKG